jgi:hypothetical protein
VSRRASGLLGKVRGEAGSRPRCPPMLAPR